MPGASPAVFLFSSPPPRWSAPVIEDDDLDRPYVTKVLSFYGIQGLAAERASDGLQALAHFRPRLILTDLRMLRMDGWEVPGRIRRCPATSDIPVVALSPEHTLRLLPRGLHHSFNDFLEKPVPPASCFNA